MDLFSSFWLRSVAGHFCIRNDSSLPAITIPRASVCFGVTRKDLREVPVMLSIPETYNVLVVCNSVRTSATEPGRFKPVDIVRTETFKFGKQPVIHNNV